MNAVGIRSHQVPESGENTPPEEHESAEKRPCSPLFRSR